MRQRLLLYSLCLMFLAVATFNKDALWTLTYGLVASGTADENIQDVRSEPLTMQVVGDVFLGRAVERRMRAYGTDYPFRGLPSDFFDADVVLANFEAAVPKQHVPTPDFGFQFSVTTDALGALQQAGTTHVSLANNHSYDFEASGYLDTKAALAQAGIRTFGNVRAGTSSVDIVSRKDEHIALVGITVVNQAEMDDEYVRLVTEIEQDSTYTLVYIHWGAEYSRAASETQTSLAKRLIDAGADAIIGHHPHVVQGIDWYDGVPIFYSLGNFIFDQYFSPAVQEGLVLDVTFLPDVVEYRLVPVTSIGSRSQPRLMSDYESELFFTELQTISSADNHELQPDGVLRQVRD